MAFDFDSFDSVNRSLGLQLFSALPGVSAANGLKAAAAASAKAQRTRGVDAIDTSGLEIKGRLAQRTADNYQRLSAKLDRAVASVTEARDTLVELKTYLSDLRRLVVLSQSDTIDDDERRQHADSFDQILGNLNIKVSASGGVSDNLIGSSIRDIFTPGEIVYQTRPDSQVTRSVTGIFSGSDYTITDGDGNVYFTDRYGAVVQQFPFDEDDAGTTISDTDTVSYDADTGAISLTADGDADPYLSGTLERKGLGVLHSFLYGNFTDPALLDEALDDIDAASATLRFNITVIEAQLGKVKAHRDYNAAFIEENQNVAIKIETEQAAALQKAALESQRQQLLFAFAFQGTTSFDASGTLLSLEIDNLIDFKI